MYCMSKRKRTQTEEKGVLELKGDYEGTGFGKHYEDCTTEEKKQRQLNFHEDIISILNPRKEKDREFIVRLRSVMYQLNILNGEPLEKYIADLSPIGTMYPRM